MRRILRLGAASLALMALTAGSVEAAAVVRSLGQEPEDKINHFVVRSYETAVATETMVAHDCALAEGGDAAASYRLGRRYLFGLGVERDRRMAVAWIAASASRGYPQALQVLAQVPSSIGRVHPWCRNNLEPVHTVAVPAGDIVALVEHLAPEYGLDPKLVQAVIEVESAYRTDAVSSKEAAGLMQLIPETAARFGVRDVFDTEENLRGGMAYLRWLLAHFHGDLTLTLAAYNAGEGAVERYRGVPPYPETLAYLRLIRALYPETSHNFEPTATVPTQTVLR